MASAPRRSAKLFDRIDDNEAGSSRGAWDGGVRYFDTSPWYGAVLPSIGSAGRSIAAARRLRHIDQDRPPPAPAARSPTPIKDQWFGGLEFETVFDYGYDGVMRSFEDSLQRLGINRVDVLLIHDLDPWTTIRSRSTPISTSSRPAVEGA